MAVWSSQVRRVRPLPSTSDRKARSHRKSRGACKGPATFPPRARNSMIARRPAKQAGGASVLRSASPRRVFTPSQRRFQCTRWTTSPASRRRLRRVLRSQNSHSHRPVNDAPSRAQWRPAARASFGQSMDPSRAAAIASASAATIRNSRAARNDALAASGQIGGSSLFSRTVSNAHNDAPRRTFLDESAPAGAPTPRRAGPIAAGRGFYPASSGVKSSPSSWS